MTSTICTPSCAGAGGAGVPAVACPPRPPDDAPGVVGGPGVDAAPPPLAVVAKAIAVRVVVSSMMMSWLSLSLTGSPSSVAVASTVTR